MNEVEKLLSLRQTSLSGQSGRLLQSLDDVVVRLSVGADRPDDCAVISLGSVDLVVGSDYVRGVKFSLYEWGYLSNYDIGYYLAAANLSDVAAMGAQPLGLLSVVRYPRTMPDTEFEAVMSGIVDACSHSGTVNLGGDIGSAERLILSGTALGVVRPGRALLRSGASPGDRLFITGPTGLAGAALAYFDQKSHDPAFSRDLSSDIEERLLRPWKRPRPRFDVAQMLSSIDGISSCQDTSDGLLATLQQLGSSSSVGFEIASTKFPITEAVDKVSSALGIDFWDLSFSSSVDFELAFTVKPQAVGDFNRASREQGLTVFEIGVATSNSDILLRETADLVRPAPGTPWTHQA